MKNNELTKYPKIFKNTYWSGGGKVADVIYENRNSFVEEFNIMSKAHERISVHVEFTRIRSIGGFRPYTYKEIADPSWNPDDFDHKEFYLTKDRKLVVIYSPYGMDAKQGSISELLGFKIYKQLYNLYSKTYVAIFKNSNDLKNKLRATYDPPASCP